MNKDILLVDDEEGTLALLSHIARDAGWEPYVATDALSALQLFEGISPSPPVVITDLRLKDNIGGVNLMSSIKKIAPLTIVIAMSGFYGESYTVSKLRHVGFDHLIRKPVSFKTIKTILDISTKVRTEWDEIMGL